MILLVIADHASDDGTEAWPSQATIAMKASVSIRTVQRCVNTLVKQGYVRMEKHAGGSASCREDRRPHRYTINLNRLRGDIVTGRQAQTNGATLTTTTGRQQRPKNHTIEPSIIIQSFEAFWKIYPRKVGKIVAKAAFEKALGVTTPQEIIESAERFASDPNRVDEFTPHPSTWLNQGRWADEPLPERTLTADERKAREKAEAEARRLREQAEYEKWKQEQVETEARKGKIDPAIRKELMEKLRGINH